MNVELITVGTELLLGDTVNTNASYLSKKMAQLGLDVYYQTSVGDNPLRLGKAFKAAFRRADMIIFTGGLGPTKDDLTKETVFDLLKLPVEIHEASYKALKLYFQRLGKEMTYENKKQVMLPKGAKVFPNDIGTAPGCALEGEDKVILFLPGPPREMHHMFERYVGPYLEKFRTHTIVSKTLRVVGLGESFLEPKIADFLAQANPSCAIYAKEGTVDIRITAKEASEQAALEQIAQTEAGLREVLGNYIYGQGEESLSDAVVALLREKGKKIATCESCTGGLLAGALTATAGASHVIDSGFVTYSNEEKTALAGVRAEALASLGAVSREVAGEMAMGTLAELPADLAIAITGIAGPDGGSEEKPVGLVYLALADDTQVYLRELRLPDVGRSGVRNRTVVAALDMVRRYLLEDPLEEVEVLSTKGFQRASRKAAKAPKRWSHWLLQGFLYLCFAAFVISAWEIFKRFVPVPLLRFFWHR